MCKFRQFYGHPDSPLHLRAYTHSCRRRLYEANKFGYSEIMAVGKTDLCRRITETKGAKKIQAIHGHVNLEIDLNSIRKWWV